MLLLLRKEEYNINKDKEVKLWLCWLGFWE